MPNIFKALATIMAWALFIICWVLGLATLIMGMVTGDLTSATPLPVVYYIAWALAFAEGIGAVVVMLLRKKLE